MEEPKNITSSNENKNILANRYTIISLLDSTGLTSIVYKVLDEETGETKVAKIFHDNFRQLFQEETKIHQMLEQLEIPNKIKFYESDIGDFTLDGNTTKKMYIIFEYASKGNLFDILLKTQKGFTEDVCKYILLILINAVDALHKEGFFHGDLKLENIVLSGDNYDIKLIDFGFTKEYAIEDNQVKKEKIFFGTRRYSAPEILEHKPCDGPKTDIFSLGAILFLLMTKSLGFAESKPNIKFPPIQNQLYQLIKQNKHEQYWELQRKHFKIKNLSPQFQKFFLKMVAYNPEERISIEEIRNDEFMAEVVNASEQHLNFLRQKMISQIENAEQQNENNI
jgi:serine/threonine protein kinase